MGQRLADARHQTVPGYHRPVHFALGAVKGRISRVTLQRNEANGDGVRWFQLYWPKNEDEEITISMLNRAKKAGYTALVVTLDTYILGWRPSDMDNGYVSIKTTGTKKSY